MVPAPRTSRSKQMTFDAEHCYLFADDASWARTTPTPQQSRNNLAIAYQAAGRTEEARNHDP